MALPQEKERKWDVTVDADMCFQCEVCLASEVCRSGSFIAYHDGERKILMARCWGCFDCADACPFEAVIVTKY